MATTQFSCCQCPQPPGYDPATDPALPKYRNKCGCPTATLECVSSEQVATLCGFSEFEDLDVDPPIVASSPPKKYAKSKETREFTGKTWTCCPPVPEVKLRSVASTDRAFSRVEEYDPNNCGSGSTVTLDTGERSLKTYNCDGDIIGTETSDLTGYVVDVDVISTIRKYANVTDTFLQTFGSCTPPDYIRSEGTTVNEFILSLEDTEADALARATETTGTACTSIYELRTDSFSFTVRTVTFGLELTNLCPGRAYEGCVRIRKRKAYSGTEPDGEVIEWEDIAPSTFGPITPDSTNTDSNGVTTDPSITDVTLPGGTVDAQGWEYQIESVHVWPVSVGCDCPTVLGYTDPTV